MSIQVTQAHVQCDRCGRTSTPQDGIAHDVQAARVCDVNCQQIGGMIAPGTHGIGCRFLVPTWQGESDAT